jgi:hypothetical protein
MVRHKSVAASLSCSLWRNIKHEKNNFTSFSPTIDFSFPRFEKLQKVKKAETLELKCLCIFKNLLGLVGASA